MLYLRCKMSCRTPGFLTGGVIPAAMAGRSLDGLIHVSDWYSTIASFFGVDPADASGPTPVTGLDMLPYVTGKVSTSPRTEVVHDHLMHCVDDGREPVPAVCHAAGQTPDFPAGHYPNHTTGGLTQLEPQADGAATKMWKLLIGPAQQASWYGRFSPNGTSPVGKYSQYVDCAPPKVCLFELLSDPGEHTNLAEQQPAVLAKLLARFKALEKEYHPPKANPPDDAAGYCTAVAKTRGYVAPWN